MSNEITIKDTSSNPAPLGLACFGLTTVLLNIHNAGFYPMNSMILGMGLFVGGLAQLLAGSMEARKNNSFGTTAFSIYGAFWMSLVAILILPKLGLAEATSKVGMGYYLLLWGIFSTGMTIGTFKISRALQVVFISLDILFFLLAIGDFTGNEMITRIAGFEGIFCGASAIYLSIALNINELYGREVMPVGHVKK